MLVYRSVYKWISKFQWGFIWYTSRMLPEDAIVSNDGLLWGSTLMSMILRQLKHPGLGGTHIPGLWLSIINSHDYYMMGIANYNLDWYNPLIIKKDLINLDDCIKILMKILIMGIFQGPTMAAGATRIRNIKSSPGNQVIYHPGPLGIWFSQLPRWVGCDVGSTTQGARMPVTTMIFITFLGSGMGPNLRLQKN